MVQKPWFKVFVWFMATFFFFLASGVIISMFKPGPSENDVMSFMSGMMGAMKNSVMGVAMSAGSNAVVSKAMSISYFMFIPIMAISIITGFAIRFAKGRKKDV